MKRKIIVLILLFLLVSNTLFNKTKADDPFFCYDGWILTAHSSLLIPGRGCSYIEDEYHCDSTNTDIVCHRLDCNGTDPFGESSCDIY